MIVLKLPDTKDWEGEWKIFHLMPVFQSDFAMHSSKRWGEVIRKSETLGWGEERRAEWHNIWRTEWVLVTWSGLRSDVVTECWLRGLDGSQSVLGLGCAPISAVSGGWELRADITWAPVMRISCWSQLRRTRRDRGPRYQRGGGIIREESTSRDRGSMLRRTRWFSAWWRTRGRGKLCTN